jgi:hypothetical protein
MIFQNDCASWSPREAVGSCGEKACDAPARRRFYIECRVCGFEPESQESLPGHACPKCYAHTWHRVIRPGTILAREIGVTSTARLRRLSVVRRG